MLCNFLLSLYPSLCIPLSIFLLISFSLSFYLSLTQTHPHTPSCTIIALECVFEAKAVLRKAIVLEESNVKVSKQRAERLEGKSVSCTGSHRACTRVCACASWASLALFEYCAVPQSARVPADLSVIVRVHKSSITGLNGAEIPSQPSFVLLFAQPQVCGSSPSHWTSRGKKGSDERFPY